jgi:hypothetical protein
MKENRDSLRKRKTQKMFIVFWDYDCRSVGRFLVICKMRRYSYAITCSGWNLGLLYTTLLGSWRSELRHVHSFLMRVVTPFNPLQICEGRPVRVGELSYYPGYRVGRDAKPISVLVFHEKLLLFETKRSKKLIAWCCVRVLFLMLWSYCCVLSWHLTLTLRSWNQPTKT